MSSQQNQTSTRPQRTKSTYSPKQQTYRLRLSQARWAYQLHWFANAMSVGLIASATVFFTAGQVNQGVLAAVGGACSTASHSRLKEMERDANNRLDREMRTQRRKSSPPK